MISDRDHRADGINMGTFKDSEDQDSSSTDTSKYSLEISSSKNEFSSIDRSTANDTTNDSAIVSVSSLSSNDEAFISVEGFFFIG